MARQVVCIGELLWDALPAGLFLGGAVANVAMHLAQLGVPAQLVSAVGDDVLGHEAVRRVARAGVDTSMVQVDAAHPTGFVEATIGPKGDARYRIVDGVAWDHISCTPTMVTAVEGASAVIVGTLAQRHEVSRSTIDALTTGDVPVVFDVNLRPPHATAMIVEETLHRATVVKVNEDELHQLAEWFGITAAGRDLVAAFAAWFAIRMLCVTRGAGGAALWHRGAWTECDGIVTTVRDTVGAGDAFLARLVAGWLAGESDDTLLNRANQLGAFVASCDGALPALTPAVREAIRLS
jgi:fructokinase